MNGERGSLRRYFLRSTALPLYSTGMANVLKQNKEQHVTALGRLGWSLPRIEQATGVRRETVGGYPRSAEWSARRPGGWGRHPVPDAAQGVADVPILQKRPTV